MVVDSSSSESAMPKHRLNVQDRVRYPFGSLSLPATVIEDRGDIGVGGRQLVVIEVKPTDETLDPYRVELPAEYLTLETSAAA